MNDGETRQPLRVLFTALGYKPAYRLGGPIISVSELAEQLVRKGHRVVVCTSDSNLTEDLDVPVNQPVMVGGVEVWYFSRGIIEKHLARTLRTIGYMYTPQMKNILRRYVPTMDVVHTHNPWSYSTQAAVQAAVRFQKPLFYQQRGVLGANHLKFHSIRKKLYINLAIRPQLRQATTLIALNQAEMESFRALEPETPCRIVPNGVDVSVYRRSPKSAVPQLGNISPKAQVILFMGRIHPTKGVDRLLQAFFQIQTSLPDAVLVAAGPDELGFKSGFQQMVSQAGLQDRVIFPGMVSGEAKLDLLARADLFCLPSDAEGFSVAVLEALASGTPVLLSPACNLPEVETAGVGRVTPPTPSELAEAIKEMLGQGERLKDMGYWGVQFVQENYSWDRVTNLLLEVYHEGISRHKPRN